MSKNYDGLIRSFAKAGLTLKVTQTQIRRLDNEDIFQLDIPRETKGNKRIEYFRIYPGHEDNLIAVQSSDANLKQVVLTVREAEREWREEVSVSPPVRARDKKRWSAPVIGQRWGRGGTVTKVSKDWVEVTYKTPKSVRHYLCGVDERQLFVCQLPKACSTVAEAHKALKRPELILHEGKAPGRTIRQGEWFFVNLTKEEMEALQKAIKEKALLIKKNEAIERGVHPHMAEEIVRVLGVMDRLNPKQETGYPIRGSEVFVRGRITHEEHATVTMRQWRKVIRNNEAGTAATIGGARANPSSGGVYWID